MADVNRSQVAALIASNYGNPNVLTVFGIRGASGDNRIGVYDDKIGMISPNIFHVFKGNTDPSRVRKGSGTGIGKGMAHLEPGYYKAHGFGLHRGKYMALIQIKGDVTVRRDGNPPYLDKGWFGINIHKGSFNSTSSLGCQTIHPNEWEDFIQKARAEARRLSQTTVPYLLHDLAGAGSAGLPIQRTGTINNGSIGPRVADLQKRLNAWVAKQPTRLFEALNPDGDFGDKTEAAVEIFQGAKGLVKDGVVGDKTWAALPLAA